jgi:PAS domain S-box-containing protein
MGEVSSEFTRPLSAERLIEMSCIETNQERRGWLGSLLVDEETKAPGGGIATAAHWGVAGFDAAYLSAIVESSDDGIIGKDLSGVIRSWNRGAEAIFGYSAADAIGRPITMLFPPDRLDEEAVILQRIRSGERVEHYETLRRRKDGSDFPVSVTISPIRDAQGTIMGASKIVRDISKQHMARTELLMAKQDLEQVVIERTNALAERDLLLREVHHRVKNNLQVVAALVVLQARKVDDPQAREALMGLHARVLALGLVHQQLMGSSDYRTFDVAPFLRELMDNVVGGAGGDGIELTVDACPLDVGLDFAVPLGLLVTEIVTNSLKHAFPDGAGQISVVLRPAAEGRFALVVSDDGRGRSQEASSAAKAGTGLTIVGRLVAQLRGEMATRHDGGTTTEILFPRLEPE